MDIYTNISQNLSSLQFQLTDGDVGLHGGFRKGG